MSNFKLTAKIAAIWVIGHIQWYLLRIILFLLSIWIKASSSILNDRLQTLFKRPGSKLDIREAYNTHENITNKMITFGSWLMENDSDGNYINVIRLQEWISDLPRYISLNGDDNQTEVLHIDEHMRKVKYCSKSGEKDMDIMFNCLQLTGYNK